MACDAGVYIIQLNKLKNSKTDREMIFLESNYRTLKIMMLFFLISTECISQSEIMMDTIADTRADFSVAYQGVNGFQYGYYDRDDVVGIFKTEDMFIDNTRWGGPS